MGSGMGPEHESPISITLDACPILSYAMAHNEVPVVTRITVDGAERDLQGVTLKLQLNDATGPVGKASEQILDLAAGQPTRITSVGSILDPAAMLQVEEQRPGWISATVESNGTLLAERSVAVRLLAA